MYCFLVERFCHHGSCWLVLGTKDLTASIETRNVAAEQGRGRDAPEDGGGKHSAGWQCFCEHPHWGRRLRVIPASKCSHIKLFSCGGSCMTVSL
jgi:hypothetical protein